MHLLLLPLLHLASIQGYHARLGRGDEVIEVDKPEGRGELSHGLNRQKRSGVNLAMCCSSGSCRLCGGLRLPKLCAEGEGEWLRVTEKQLH